MARTKLVNKSLVAVFQEKTGFSVSNRDDKIGGVFIKGTAQDAQRFIDWIASDNSKDELVAAGFTKGTGRSREFVCERDDFSFVGGSFDELKKSLAGEMDMSRFLNARKALEKTGFVSRLRERIAQVSPRRARKMSEHDGEWDYDRRWEIQAFQSTAKKIGAGRTIRIVANLCVSARVSPEKIDDFAARVWAVSDILEDSGIQTDVICRYDSRGMTARHSETDNTLIEIAVKATNQYIHPVKLAAFFRSLNYRRTIFGLYPISAAIMGTEVSGGLGQPAHAEFPVKWISETGSLTLNISTIDGSTDQLEREILASVS